MKTKQDHDSTKRILVWDLPTRIFHWLLAICFAFAWIVSEDSRYLYHHVYAGYTFLGLLIFRLLWGMIGSHYAKFHSFAYDWPSVRAYLRGLLDGSAARHIGHNPAGSWAIFAILIFGFLSAVTGLIVLGGEENHGPLAGLVSFDVGDMMREAHEFFTNAMVAIVVLHIAGVIVESYFHKENLVWSMITGYKETLTHSPMAKPYALVGTLMVTVVVASGIYYFKGYIVETPDKLFVPYQGPKLADNDTWRKECGDCHLAYHPVLLPARSWQRMMTEQSDHFGEDLGLDAEAVTVITQFLVENAAETSKTEAANRMIRTIPANEAPLRVTETRYWKREHRDINSKYWKTKPVENKINCGACHLDANEGWFEDSNMRLPKL